MVTFLANLISIEERGILHCRAEFTERKLHANLRFKISVELPRRFLQIKGRRQFLAEQNILIQRENLTLCTFPKTFA